MADPLRSADRAYYSSKTPLNLRGSQEGRKNPVPVPTYRHKGNDVTASSSKYYASMVPTPVPQAVTQRPVKQVTLILETAVTALDQVVQAFAAEATDVQVQGDADLIRKAQVAVDSAVGRSQLTRAQADAVTFVVKATAPEIAPESDTAVITPPVAEITPEPEPELIVELEPEAEPEPATANYDVELLAEAEALLNVPAPKKPSRKKGKKADSKDITEADIAAAFGVGDDGDD
jgi:hypothetical protein